MPAYRDTLLGAECKTFATRFCLKQKADNAAYLLITTRWEYVRCSG